VAAPVLVLGWVLLCGALPSRATAEAKPIDCAERMARHAGAWRALPPGTATQLKRAIAGGEPELHLWEAQLVCDEIDAVICTRPEGQGSCAHLMLSDPDRGCRGTVAGPYCAVWEEQMAPQELREPILKRLDDRAPRDVWRPVERSASSVDVPGGPTAQEVAAWPMILSLLCLLLLLGLGVLLGRLTEPSLGLRASLPLAMGLLVAWLAPTISTWDLLGAAGLVSGSAWLSGRPDGLSNGTWAKVVGVLVISALILEGLVRLWLPTPPQSPPPQQARLVFSPEAREEACRALFPTDYPGVMPRSLGSDRTVLHLGDSMVYGTGVEPSDRFTSLLSRRSKDAEHLNAGFPGTGPDHHLAVLRAWLPALKPDAVVLYLYPGNDLLDLDRSYACCDHGPLQDSAFESRCETPSWAFPFRALLARSPAPYPLRASSAHLHLAAHLSAAFSRITASLEPSLGDAAGSKEVESAWSRYGGSLGAIRDVAAEHNVTLTAVLLPTRVALEPGAAPSHATGVADRMLKVARQESLQVLDARPWIAPLARDGSFAHLFGDGVTWDEHLSETGHESFATWLFERL
jgi:hypothetical protein